MRAEETWGWKCPRGCSPPHRGFEGVEEVRNNMTNVLFEQNSKLSWQRRVIRANVKTYVHICHQPKKEQKKSNVDIYLNFGMDMLHWQPRGRRCAGWCSRPHMRDTQRPAPQPNSSLLAIICFIWSLPLGNVARPPEIRLTEGVTPSTCTESAP